MHNPANRDFDNMWWRSALLFGIFFLNEGLAQPVVQVIEDIAHQAFRTVGYVDTLIYWDASEYIASSISKLTYPKIIVDRTKGLANFFCENRLVIIELDGTDERLQTALSGSSHHHLVKFVVLLSYNSELSRTLLLIDHYFDYAHIMKYVVVIHYSELGEVKEVGYMKSNKFILLNKTVNFEEIFKARLKNLPFRAIVTNKRPYSYRSEQNEVQGIDIDVAKIVTKMMGIHLSLTHLNDSNVPGLEDYFFQDKMDVYLTRQGCNNAAQLPQLEHQEKFRIRIMMPKIQNINFYLEIFKPYKAEVWYLLLLLIILACALNWLFRRRMRVSILMVIIFGYHRETSRWMAVLLLATQFLKVVLLESYLGQMTSFMIQMRYEERPKTLEQFFASNVMLNEPVAMNYYFTHLPLVISMQWQPKFRPNYTSTVDHSGAYEPGHAYLVLEYASGTMKSEFTYESVFNSSFFYILREPLFEIRMCTMFGVWSKFFARYKECLEWLYAAGIINKLAAEEWKFSSKTLNTFTVLMFADLIPVFLFLCYGWAVSVICLLLEISFLKLKQLLWKYKYRHTRLFLRTS
uniref:Uncharacterized protein n=1 Tax=Anopheles gambiae TaxID=7165 RepID=A0A499FX18_ANOGA